MDQPLIRLVIPGHELKKKFFLIKVELIYNVVLVSSVQQSDSVLYIYIYIYIYIYLPFQILFHYRLLQDIEYRFPVLYSRSLLFI